VLQQTADHETFFNVERLSGSFECSAGQVILHAQSLTSFQTPFSLVVEGASCRGRVTRLTTNGRVLQIGTGSCVDIDAVNVSCSQLGGQAGGDVHLQGENVSCSSNGYLLGDGAMYGSFVDFFAGAPITASGGVLDFSANSLVTGNNTAFDLSTKSTLRIGRIATGITELLPVLSCSGDADISLNVGRIETNTSPSNAYGIDFSGFGQLNAVIDTCILPQATLFNTSDEGSVYLSGQLFRKTATPPDTTSFAAIAIVASTGNAPIEVNVDAFEITASSPNHAAFFVEGNDKGKARLAGHCGLLRRPTVGANNKRVEAR
jgi:hypothetical protein